MAGKMTEEAARRVRDDPNARNATRCMVCNSPGHYRVPAMPTLRASIGPVGLVIGSAKSVGVEMEPRTGEFDRS
jgi:hypothetical protein